MTIGISISIGLILGYGFAMFLVRHQVHSTKQYYLAEIEKMKHQVIYWGWESHGKYRQMYIDFPDNAVQLVRVPYNTVQTYQKKQYKVFYIQHWTRQDWQAFKDGKIWVERTINKCQTKRMWVDTPTDKDTVLNKINLDFDQVSSEIPCGWEYKGYELVAA